MTYISIFALLFTTAAFANDCGSSLGSASQFAPDDADRARLVAKIMEHVGEDRHFDDIDGGNSGTHAYLIPHERTARFVEILSQVPGGPNVELMMEKYAPESHIFVGVLETDDEPQLTVILFPRDPAQPVLRAKRKLNPTDAEDQPALREILPGAWDEEGYYQSFHVLWASLTPSVEVPLPWRHPNERWDISAYE